MAEYLMIAAISAHDNADRDRGFMMYLGTQFAMVERDWFEDNAVEIEPGTGKALKAVCATALLTAMHTGTIPLPGLPGAPANDEPSAAERGEFNAEMITAVARIAYNVVREWRKKEGLLHHPQFDLAPKLQQQMAETRVRNIAENKRYPLDISNATMVFEDQMYRIVTASVLAD